MNYNRSFNFSAGPAMMPEKVLEEIRDEMMNVNALNHQTIPGGAGAEIGVPLL